jgi:hypothetical protein
MITQLPLTGRYFLEGAAGTGKTTESAEYARRLIESGVPPERLLILVPQRDGGRPYLEAVNQLSAGGAPVVTTYIGLAMRSVTQYWPIIAEPAGFAEPSVEPTPLGTETAQYFMARAAKLSVSDGHFAGVSLSHARIVSQTLDNLSRAAFLGETLQSVTERLTDAWGARGESRPNVYGASQKLGEAFRQLCLDNNLIDYSLAVELFNRYLLSDPAFRVAFFTRYQYLIVDNVEEMNAAAHDLIKEMIPRMQGAVITYDFDAGYRMFLGSEPGNAYELSKNCTQVVTRSEDHVMSIELSLLLNEFARELEQPYTPFSVPELSPLDALRYELKIYYPEMIEWVATHIAELVLNNGVSPSQIAVVMPFLNESLRFTLTYRLRQLGIPFTTERPSRPLREEPVARSLVTLAKLSYPSPSYLPTYSMVATALENTITGLDPLRARMLVAKVYAAKTGTLRAFAEVDEETRTRIGYELGARYDSLREWLTASPDPLLSLDHFWQRLFGEKLATPGYRFEGDRDAGRITALLIGSAVQFREALHPTLLSTAHPDSFSEARDEYFGVFDENLQIGDYIPDWRESLADAVFIAPATTFLLKNRVVDYQFWVDIGSSSWVERIEQPLTHPYVLRRENSGVIKMWSDKIEEEQTTLRLYALITGLIRRTRKGIYLGVAQLGEGGMGQQGRLLLILEQIIKRNLPDSV